VGYNKGSLTATTLFSIDFCSWWY